jgi:diguanylate cyclase (GGDEF)-like protein
MAASTPYPRSPQPQPGGAGCLSTDALLERLEEEISRADRHGTDLSCLLVVIENLDELSRAHGQELREQALGYVADALRRELRRFDRVGRPSDRELAIVLPGADGPRGEMVARRVLDRLRTIKVEAGGERRALVLSVGLSAWREGRDARTLLDRARAASRQGNGEERTAANGGQLTPIRQDERQGTGAPSSSPPQVPRPARS